MRLLGHDITIHFTDPGIGRDVYGSWDRTTMTITISDTIHKQDQMSTLVHEVVHAIEDIMDLGLTEQQVSGLSQGLYSLFRDNPGIFRETK